MHIILLLLLLSTNTPTQDHRRRGGKWREEKPTQSTWNIHQTRDCSLTLLNFSFTSLIHKHNQEFVSKLGSPRPQHLDTGSPWGVSKVLYIVIVHCTNICQCKPHLPPPKCTCFGQPMMGMSVKINLRHLMRHLTV